jgi:hypothetical protein
MGHWIWKIEYEYEKSLFASKYTNYLFSFRFSEPQFYL